MQYGFVVQYVQLHNKYAPKLFIQKRLIDKESLVKKFIIKQPEGLVDMIIIE